MTENTEFISETNPKATSENYFGSSHDGSVFTYHGQLLETDIDKLLSWAYSRKGSDITIQSDEFIKAKIGGRIYPISHRPLNSAEVETVVRYVYGDQAVGTLKRGYDIDTAHEVRDPDNPQMGTKRYRINMTSGRVDTSEGIQITVRTLPQTPVKIDILNIEPEIIDNFHPDRGMVLVTGPTGSGKSTLLSSGIRHILEQPNASVKVLEYSRPIEYVYDGIVGENSSLFQTEVGKHLMPFETPGGTSEESLFSYAVRNALRRNPDIIIIGETRDTATMNASMEAALSGHTLYSTMHTIGVLATMRRIIQFFPTNERDGAAIDAMSTMHMIVSQLLFPKIGGGMIGLREFMVFDDSIRSKFLKKPVDEWPYFAYSLLHGKKVIGKKMSDSAWDAYDAGLIEEDVWMKIVESERNQK